MQIREVPMDDLVNRQSDTLSEPALSISSHIVKTYEEEPPMNNMTEWVKWRAPQLAVPQWMREELRRCGKCHKDGESYH